MYSLSHYKNRLWASSLARGFLAYGSAEMLNRVVRLVVVMLMAWRLSPEIMGTAALALTLFELTRVLTNFGVGQKIIMAEDQELPAVCNRAYQLFGMGCVLVAGLQLLLAAIMIFQLDKAAVGQILAALSLVYFFMPGGLVQCYLLMRAKRMQVIAWIAATQNIADHLLTCALVLVWPSPWSIALPKLITAPIWLMAMRRAYTWEIQPQYGYAPTKRFLNFSASFLASELFAALRNQADKLIIAAALGVSALGSYYFAYNVSIGIIGMLISALGVVIYPHMHSANLKGKAKSFVTNGLLAGAIIFPLFIAAQIVLAPYYVPIIFGRNWEHATSLICILSFASWPLFLQMMATTFLRIRGQAGAESIWSGAACLAGLVAVWLGSRFDLNVAAISWVSALYLAIGAMVAVHLLPFVAQRALQKEKESLS